MNSLKSSLQRWEGTVPYMYLDSRGNPSCGIGHLLPTPESACELPFTMASGAILATREDITREYVSVKMLESNHGPVYYALRTSLRLSDATVDALLDHDIAAAERSLASFIGGFTKFPDPAQDALLDMAFNLGSGGLHRYSRLLAACTTGNWAVAADECHRKGIPEERNEATAALFRGLANADTVSQG